MWPTDSAAAAENRAHNLHRRFFMPTKQEFCQHSEKVKSDPNTCQSLTNPAANPFEVRQSW